MEVHLDSEEAAMARATQGQAAPAGPHRDAASGSRRSDRPNPDRAGGRMARPLGPRSGQASPPWSAEVHDQARHQADLYVAGLLAKASERPEMAEHIAGVTAAAEAPLRPVENKQRPLVVRLPGGLAITVMTPVLLPARHAPARDEAARGAGCTPELAAYRISEGSSPNVQAAVGRQVALLPIEQARGEDWPGTGWSWTRRRCGHRQRTGGPDAGQSDPRSAPLPPR